MDGSGFSPIKIWVSEGSGSKPVDAVAAKKGVQLITDSLAVSRNDETLPWKPRAKFSPFERSRMPVDADYHFKPHEHLWSLEISSREPQLKQKLDAGCRLWAC